jgi:hypothetical protein
MQREEHISHKRLWSEEFTDDQRDAFLLWLSGVGYDTADVAHVVVYPVVYKGIVGSVLAYVFVRAKNGGVKAHDGQPVVVARARKYFTPCPLFGA